MTDLDCRDAQNFCRLPFDAEDKFSRAAAVKILWTGDRFIVAAVAGKFLDLAFSPARNGDFCAIGGRFLAAKIPAIREIFTRYRVVIRDFWDFADFVGEAADYQIVWIIFRGATADFSTQQVLRDFENLAETYRFWGAFREFPVA